MELDEVEIYRHYRGALLSGKSFSHPHESTTLLELSRQFKAILFDGFGTLYNLHHVHKGSVAILDELRSSGCALRLITNAASRHPNLLGAHLKTLGLHFADHEIICSGSLLARANLQLGIRSALHLGREDALCFFDSAGIQASEHPEEPTVIISSALPGGDPLYTRAKELLSQPQGRLIVLNPDAWAPRRDGTRMPVSGSLAWSLRQETQCQSIYLGKPFGDIFRVALESLPLGIGPAVMVGDTLGTDILGGQAAGIRTALMLGGNSTWESLNIDEEQLGIFPDFYLDTLQ